MNSILTFAIIAVLMFTGNVSVDGWQAILLGMMELISPCVLVPRFILSLRELYACDLQGRRGSDINTAFGFTSGSGHGAVASTIMGEDQGEEIQMEGGKSVALVVVHNGDCMSLRKNQYFNHDGQARVRARECLPRILLGPLLNYQSTQASQASEGEESL